MPEGGAAQWFKYGCLGCLGVVAVIGVAVAVLFAVAALGGRDEQVEERVLTPEIPTAVAMAAEGIAGGGYVLVEIREAEVRIRPAEPGESLRVEARYDTNAFVLEDNLETGTGEDDGWAYTLSFDREGGNSGVVTELRTLMRGTTPKLTVFLPRDVPIDLEIDLEEGGAFVQLDGLWLTRADLGFSKGGVDLRVDGPLREPLERMSIRTAMGGATLSGIGNASPRRLSIDFSMGGVTVDLGGQWVTDSEISITGSMGGGTVRLPDGVIIKGLARDGLEAPAEPELKPPTLTFSVTSSMGEVEFYD